MTPPMDHPRIAGFVAGLVTANALPHLATAAAGRRLMTPFGGAASGRRANAAWGGINLAAGLALVARSSVGEDSWPDHVAAFGAGGATFLAWSATAEAVLRFNAAE